MVMLPKQEPVLIPSDKDRDLKVRSMPESLHGGGPTGKRVPLKGVNDNSSNDIEDTITVSAKNIQTELNLRGDFETALRSFIEDFKANEKKPELPDAPAREYRARESIIDYLRSPEGFGPWMEAGALTRPLIREKSPKAYMALANWLRKNELPTDFPMLTKSEAIRQSASQVDEAAMQSLKRAHAAYERQRYAAQKLD